jgi:hypothetical protein
MVCNRPSPVMFMELRKELDIHAFVIYTAHMLC